MVGQIPSEGRYKIIRWLIREYYAWRMTCTPYLFRSPKINVNTNPASLLLHFLRTTTSIIIVDSAFKHVNSNGFPNMAS